MAPMAARAAEKHSLTQLSGVGIGERQLQPTIRHKPFKLGSITLGQGTALLLLTIVLEANPFHLTFTGAGFTGINDRFATGDVQGELVPWHLAFLPAAALAPPVGIACLRASFRRSHHCELSVDLTDSVSWG